MRITEKQPPRVFEVGDQNKYNLKDCACIQLEANEQVTFLEGYDVVRKSWGFYATPSTNGRLAKHGLKTVIVRNKKGQAFVLLIEDGKEEDFQDYAKKESLTVVGWLNTDELVQSL